MTEYEAKGSVSTGAERSPVARVEALVVSVPAEGNAFAEGSEETLLARVTDEAGNYGIGESVCTPEVIKAMIDQETIHFWSQGIADIVVGTDPLEARATYDRVYHGSFYHGRRERFGWCFGQDHRRLHREVPRVARRDRPRSGPGCGLWLSLVGLAGSGVDVEADRGLRRLLCRGSPAT